ncbi:sigma-70 family RNA polymerase sigma factor [Flavobacteriales bacterium]|nr:sigma-70 family RNA polymerase sigma factor [Flavobacteriales bacterium]
MKDLIEGCKNNDRRAQFKLYAQEYNTLIATAFRYHNNKEDAAAAVNLAFFKILDKIKQYNPTRPFGAWARRILINTIIDEHKANKSFKEALFLDDLPQNIHIDLEATETVLDKDQVDTILNQLGDQERIVFNLYEVDGYRHKEIGEQLSISERSSKRYLAKARLQIKTIVTQLNTAETIGT